MNFPRDLPLNTCGDILQPPAIWFSIPCYCIFIEMSSGFFRQYPEDGGWGPALRTPADIAYFLIICIVIFILFISLLRLDLNLTKILCFIVMVLFIRHQYEQPPPLFPMYYNALPSMSQVNFL